MKNADVGPLFGILSLSRKSETNAIDHLLREEKYIHGAQWYISQMVTDEGIRTVFCTEVGCKTKSKAASRQILVGHG